jgi:hypothetical protein
MTTEAATDHAHQWGSWEQFNPIIFDNPCNTILLGVPFNPDLRHRSCPCGAWQQESIRAVIFSL